MLFIRSLPALALVAFIDLAGGGCGGGDRPADPPPAPPGPVTAEYQEAMVDLAFAETRANQIEYQIREWGEKITEDEKRQLTDRARAAREVAESMRRGVKAKFRRVPDRDDLTPSQRAAVHRFDSEGGSAVGHRVFFARQAMDLDLIRRENVTRPQDLLSRKNVPRPQVSMSQRLETTIQDIAEDLDRLEAVCRAAAREN